VNSRSREALQELATIRQAEGAFSGLSWHDAKHAAVAILADAINGDDVAGKALRRHIKVERPCWLCPHERNVEPRTGPIDA
jgi:hypothetical protein